MITIVHGHRNPIGVTSALPVSWGRIRYLMEENEDDGRERGASLDMEIVVKCLTTLQHLFSWLPLSSHVPPSLVTTVFYWGSTATQSQSTEAALAGLGGVCELLYRRYAPPSSATTALRLHHCALRLLRHLIHSPHHMHHAHHDYLNKLAEFLRLFVSLHFKRLEAEPEFDAIEFLSYLFQFTFQVSTGEALRALVDKVLNKIQFQHNKAQLQQLDNDTCDDDGETEWQTFLKHCIECIARVADLAPLDVFTLVLDRWQCMAGVHARAAGRSGATVADDRLLAALLDLATLTRVLGRLAPVLLTEEEGERRAAASSAAAVLVERVAGTLAGAALTRPHRQSTHHAHALLQVHAEMFACMGAWCRYAGECGLPARLMEGLFTSALPFLMPHDIPEAPLLCHAAAHLILSLSKNVKFTSDPVSLVDDLFNQAQRSLLHLEPKTGGVVREALLSLALCRSTGGSGRGEAAARALLAAWSAPLTIAGPVITLPPLTALLLAFVDAATHAKKILAEGIQGAAETALQMLCESACAAAEGELTDFFLALFRCLLQHIGPFAYAAIDVFLQVVQRGGSDASLERLLECVRLGVEAGGGVRVPAVLQLVTQHALPRAHTPDVARPVYTLLASILIHRWRYFFPIKCDVGEEARRMEELRGVLAAVGRALLEPDIELFRLNLKTLDTLNTKWKLYHKVIFRSEFLAQFLSVLLASVCERGGGRALLRDEVLAAIHAMAAVDFLAFRRAFLPHFLSSLSDLTPQHIALLSEFPPDTDLPTFTQNIQRLMNDVNCYREYTAHGRIAAPLA
ncbi:Exportin-6 [Eumeta japonica]|uniref:Exportin-6 n=1 Tax=Eumeta variegata TaxID=151549 RepID=A0A4C1XAD2_EUMVA|nr:Exportin-6 [Eumeta japonica]